MRFSMRRVRAATLLPAFLLVTAGLVAQDPGAEEQMSWSEFVTTLDPRSGEITVQGGKASVALPDGWHYLEQQAARHVVEEVWGNPPDPTTLGLIVPPGWESDDESSPTWAIIVSYDDEGHVLDDDASTIDYDELLSGLQEDTRAGAEERRRAGYPAVELVGWAERPHYDSQAKKLYWAKHLKFDGGPGTLNYDIRILGRRGTLVLSAVAGMNELQDVRTASTEILPAVQFVSGERYEDYQEGIDPVVAGGIGALIAGKLLLKGGFLKVLLGLWKPIAIGIAALGALLFKVFKSKREAAAASPE